MCVSLIPIILKFGFAGVFDAATISVIYGITPPDNTTLITVPTLILLSKMYFPGIGQPHVLQLNLED